VTLFISPCHLEPSTPLFTLCVSNLKPMNPISYPICYNSTGPFPTSYKTPLTYAMLELSIQLENPRTQERPHLAAKRRLSRRSWVWRRDIVASPARKSSTHIYTTRAASWLISSRLLTRRKGSHAPRKVLCEDSRSAMTGKERNVDRNSNTSAAIEYSDRSGSGTSDDLCDLPQQDLSYL
jgi:hypothetical protein